MKSITAILQSEEQISLKKQIEFVWSLSVPAILAQITSIIMQYIDTAMVGKLGADAAASIGVVASSTWLLFGISSASCAGFTVQLAQAVGGREENKIQNLVRQSIVVVLSIAIVLATICFFLGFKLPVWLGADVSIQRDSSHYFCIFSLSLPLVMLMNLCCGLLECSGDMKTPSILSILTCVLDILFNFIFIFVFKFGVAGAALGTAMSELVVCVLLLYFVLMKSSVLKLRAGGTWKPCRIYIRNSIKIGLPMAFEQTALCGAQILSTRIIAPLGNVSLAANSFAVTAEALCYMPGYGVAAAATTLVGQSIGAEKTKFAKHFAWLTVVLGMLIMAFTGAIMYLACPYVFRFFTSDLQVQALGVKVLRIELFAEPLFAAYIVASGALRGAGDTLFTGIFNLISMWGVRLTLTLLLVSKYGIEGAWIAMAVELCFRGILFLGRMSFQKWKKL